MCRIHDSAIQTQGQGHNSKSWDLALNSVSALYLLHPGRIFIKLSSNVHHSKWMCKTHDSNHVRIQRGGQGVRTPLENYKNIGFLSNTGPDPLRITKLPSQYSMLGHHRPASEMPFKWRFAGGPFMAKFDPL